MLILLILHVESNLKIKQDLAHVSILVLIIKPNKQRSTKKKKKVLNGLTQ